jgi:hypothetical protein
MELSDMGPRHYTSGLAHVGKDIRVIDNREIRLSDGSPAYRTDIEWKYKGVFPVTTLLTTAFKDGKCVYVAAHPGKYNFAAEKIVSSLVLK